METIGVQKDLFVTMPIDGGYRWTLASRLGDILLKAEQMYGQRDKAYTILGFEFIDDRPQVWFPKNNNNVLIQLNIDCMNDITRAIFQLSHEIVHCLCPIGSRSANILEEGLATHFSLSYTLANTGVMMGIAEQEYIMANKLVSQLLGIDPQIIIKVRQVQPTISLMKVEDFLSINPTLDVQLITQLCQPFSTLTA